MIKEEELYYLRTLGDLELYINNIRNEVKFNSNERKLAHLKKGPYKKFLEELVPLFTYAKTKHSDNPNYQFGLVKGNNAYDAIILDSSKLIEKIEFTLPVDGKAEHQIGKEINDKGYSCVSFWNYDEKKVLKERILSKAKDKSLRQYNDTTLIIMLVLFPLLDVTENEDMDYLREIVNELKEIAYLAESVYLITFPEETNTRISESMIFTIKSPI